MVFIFLWFSGMLLLGFLLVDIANFIERSEKQKLIDKKVKRITELTDEILLNLSKRK